MGQLNNGFSFWPVMFGQKETLRDSMTWQLLLMAERPASVKTVQPLRSKDVKVRPTAKQICTKLKNNLYCQKQNCRKYAELVQVTIRTVLETILRKWFYERVVNSCHPARNWFCIMQPTEDSLCCRPFSHKKTHYWKILVSFS